jgi:hypothetical protein
MFLSAGVITPSMFFVSFLTSQGSPRLLWVRHHQSYPRHQQRPGRWRRLLGSTCGGSRDRRVRSEQSIASNA